MLSSAWAPGLPRSHLSPGSRDGVSRVRYQRETEGTAPQQGEAGLGQMKLHCTPPPSPAKSYMSTSARALGKGSEHVHTRNLSTKMAK